MIARRLMLTSLASGLACTGWPATAAPAAYTLERSRSTVGFSYLFQGQRINGIIPFHDAKITLDLADVTRSHVVVRLDAAAATAGFLFATQTMRGPKVLDVANHPLIRFETTKISGTVNKATITGALSLRGQTHPVTLQGQLFQQRATQDLSKLSILLNGQIDRRDFGADGLISTVGPMLELRILVRMTQA